MGTAHGRTQERSRSDAWCCRVCKVQSQDKCPRPGQPATVRYER